MAEQIGRVVTRHPDGSPDQVEWIAPEDVVTIRDPGRVARLLDRYTRWVEDRQIGRWLVRLRDERRPR